MLYHHSNLEYPVAASEAAKLARDKMEQIIDDGRASAVSVIEQVESMIIKDRLALNSTIKFSSNGNSIGVQLQRLDEEYQLHPHALLQSMSRADIPNSTGFLRLMQSHGEVGNELLAHNLTTLFGQSSKMSLVRTVEGDVRGLLSNRFRRMDSRPLLASFIEACKTLGAIPIKGYREDTKVVLRAVLPYVFEPVDNEVMIFGIEWRNSDFGDGCHSVKLWTMRLWCTNTAILDEVLRQVHLGTRLDESINFSQQTYALETETTASKLYDVVRDCIGPARVQLYLESIKKANEEKIDPRQASDLLKSKFGKEDRLKIIDAFNSTDVEMMPAGNTKWRLSNAISWVANAQDTTDKQLYFQDAARMVLDDINLKPVVIEPIE